MGPGSLQRGGACCCLWVGINSLGLAVPIVINQYSHTEVYLLAPKALSCGTLLSCSQFVHNWSDSSCWAGRCP